MFMKMKELVLRLVLPYTPCQNHTRTEYDILRKAFAHRAFLASQFHYFFAFFVANLGQERVWPVLAPFCFPLLLTLSLVLIC
jgi:hypothetical protein